MDSNEIVFLLTRWNQINNNNYADLILLISNIKINMFSICFQDITKIVSIYKLLIFVI